MGSSKSKPIVASVQQVTKRTIEPSKLMIPQITKDSSSYVLKRPQHVPPMPSPSDATNTEIDREIMKEMSKWNVQAITQTTTSKDSDEQIPACVVRMGENKSYTSKELSKLDLRVPGRLTEKNMYDFYIALRHNPQANLALISSDLSVPEDTLIRLLKIARIPIIEEDPENPLLRIAR